MVRKDIPLDRGWIKIRCTSCPIVIHKVDTIVFHKVDRQADLLIDCYMVMVNILGMAEDTIFSMPNCHSKGANIDSQNS